MFDLIPRKKENQMDVFDVMDDFFKNSFFVPSTNYTSGVKTDVKETDDEYILEAEMPGFDKKDISMEVNNNYLTISAEKKEEKKEDKDGYIRRERRFGSMCRSFNIEGIDQDKIKAKYNNGILEVVLPKTKKEIKESKKLEIE